MQNKSYKTSDGFNWRLLTEEEAISQLNTPGVEEICSIDSEDVDTVLTTEEQIKEAFRQGLKIALSIGYEGRED